MIALSVYDRLTPGSLTGGHNVAGTGTIAVDGKVGPIGGIRQKIVGARNSGATLFFVPPANCAEATPSPTNGIRLVRADTLQSAVQSLQTYAKNPQAELPRCSGG
jgi:PDZ domain-containing protein